MVSLFDDHWFVGWPTGVESDNGVTVTVVTRHAGEVGDSTHWFSASREIIIESDRLISLDNGFIYVDTGSYCRVLVQVDQSLVQCGLPLIKNGQCRLGWGSAAIRARGRGSKSSKSVYKNLCG